MLTGGLTVFVWKLVLKPLGGLFGIYELLPAFLLSCVAIVLVSLLTKEPARRSRPSLKKSGLMFRKKSGAGRSRFCIA